MGVAQEVSETDISKSDQIKPKLSARIDTTGGVVDECELGEITF